MIRVLFGLRWDYALLGALLAPVILSNSGCRPSPPTTQPPAMGAHHVAAPSSGPLPPDGPVSIPPGMKREDISRYVAQQLTKRRRGAEFSQHVTAFGPQMEAALSNAQYATVIAISKRYSLEQPKDGLGSYYLGQAQLYNGDLSGALAAWQKAERLSPALKTRIAPLRARVQRIRRQFPNLQLPPVQAVKSDILTEKTRYFDLGKRLLLAKQYDQIESVVARFEREKRACLDGTTAATHFMSGLRYQDDPTPQTDEGARWQQSVDRLEAWHRARPNSNLALAALIEVKTDWAWQTRGTEYASQVSAGQWQQVRRHLQDAEPLVRALRPNVLQSPLYCKALVHWSHLSGLPARQMRAMWRPMEQCFPDDVSLALAWTTFLLPQWNGQPGEWQNFASAWASQRPGIEGDILYAQFMVGLIPSFDETLWSQGVSWPRTRRGLEALVKRHPQSLGLATGLMAMAYDAKDYKAAQTALLQQVRGRANTARYPMPHRFAVLRLDILDPQGR